ncbi:hypothetical protein [Mesorhizobium sp. Pch-S]|uniref:hypothetical protein n=1 Tax=Mesorhizobium sp. Pch-S TaxID=2082387 RepID=UPI00101072EC|nr:hypothetical protein [Mesorhizobium sp. Pch-S]
MSNEVKRGRPPKAETLPVRLNTAYWPLDGRGRQDEGSEIELPADEARGIVEKGLAVRNDAF